MKNKTKYQKTHAPIKRIQNKCDGEIVDGECVKCGRFVDKKGKHNPTQIGQLGWYEVYGDGSTYNTNPDFVAESYANWSKLLED